jgi:hypothetical protein
LLTEVIMQFARDAGLLLLASSPLEKHLATIISNTKYATRINHGYIIDKIPVDSFSTLTRTAGNLQLDSSSTITL